MGYLSSLPMSPDRTWVDGITKKSRDTILYMTIAGDWQAELLDCLDCIYLDDRRDFELIQIKSENRIIGVCVAMKPTALALRSADGTSKKKENLETEKEGKQ